MVKTFGKNAAVRSRSEVAGPINALDIETRCRPPQLPECSLSGCNGARHITWTDRRVDSSGRGVLVVRAHLSRPNYGMEGGFRPQATTDAVTAATG